MTFEVGKTYRTKGGWDAKVEHIDIHDRTILAIHQDGGGGRTPVIHNMDGTADLKEGGFEDYTLIDPSDTPTTEPDYETRLRDQAALAYIGILKDIGCGCDLDAHDYNLCVHNFTDAFMAERKKRMEENGK